MYVYTYREHMKTVTNRCSRCKRIIFEAPLGAEPLSWKARVIFGYAEPHEHYDFDLCEDCALSVRRFCSGDGEMIVDWELQKGKFVPQV